MKTAGQRKKERNESIRLSCHVYDTRTTTESTKVLYSTVQYKGAETLATKVYYQSANGEHRIAAI